MVEARSIGKLEKSTCFQSVKTICPHVKIKCPKPHGKFLHLLLLLKALPSVRTLSVSDPYTKSWNFQKVLAESVHLYWLLKNKPHTILLGPKGEVRVHSLEWQPMCLPTEICLDKSIYLDIWGALKCHISQDGRWVVWANKSYCMEIRRYPASWIYLPIDFHYSLQKVEGRPSRFSLISM